MKKMAVVILMFMIIVGGFKAENDFTLLNYFSGEYSVYTSTNSDGAINLGFCYMSTNPGQENVLGESMKIEQFEVGTALETLNAKVVKTEYLDDGTTVIYAYSQLIDETVKAYGHNVNLQIAIKDEKTIIGWPLILGSY